MTLGSPLVSPGFGGACVICLPKSAAGRPCQDDAAQDFLRVADILEPGLNAGRNVMGDRMRGELPQGLKFQII